MSETRIRHSCLSFSDTVGANTTLSGQDEAQPSQPRIRQTLTSSPSETPEESTFRGSDDDTGDDAISTSTACLPANTIVGCSATLSDFVYFAVIFAAVPGSTLACFGLATTRLGNLIGAWQSGWLYVSYTLTALTVATPVVQTLGSKTAIQVGMWFMNGYVTCFWIASTVKEAWVPLIAYMGAAIGGIGAGIFWTAQGTYFACAAQALTEQSNITSSAWLASLFATILLLEETILDILSTVLVRHWHVSWRMVFGVYMFIAVSATVFMRRAHNFEVDLDRSNHPSLIHDQRWYFKLTAAVSLLINDSKLKYLCGLPIVFGISGGFVNSFVSGQLVPMALGYPSNNSTVSTTPVETSSSPDTWIGAFTALHGMVAVVTSLFLACFDATTSCSRQATSSSSPTTSKPTRTVRRADLVILISGTLLLGAIGALHVWDPNQWQWTWKHISLVYILQGIGRATFEATLKAVFADCYNYEFRKEAAFANILLHNGVWSFVSYALSIHLYCAPPPSQTPTASHNSCWQYRDGSWHDIGILAWLLVVASLFATVGYGRAWYLLQIDQHPPCLNTDGHAPATRRSSKLPLQPPLGVGWSSYQTVETDETEDVQGTELAELK